MKTIIVLTLFFTATVTSANVPFEGKQAVVTAEFIYLQDEVAFPSCHASTIAETSEGVVAAWFGGTHEKHPDVTVYSAKYDDADLSPEGYIYTAAGDAGDRLCGTVSYKPQK